MIQRIQTLYIVLGSIVLFFLYSEITTDSTGENKFWFYIQLPCLVLSLLSIFSYKNRKRQIKLLYGLIFLVVLMLLFLLTYLPLSMAWSSVPYYIGALLAIIFYILAIKRIKKDDDLIKSIDRIR